MGGGERSGGPAPISLGKPLAFDGQARDQEEDTPMLSTRSYQNYSRKLGKHLGFSPIEVLIL